MSARLISGLHANECDLIDYDQLLTGQRSEAMFAMVETHIQQPSPDCLDCLLMISLIASLIALLIAGSRWSRPTSSRASMQHIPF